MMVTFPLSDAREIISPVGVGPSNAGAISPRAVGLEGVLIIASTFLPETLLFILGSKPLKMSLASRFPYINVKTLIIPLFSFNCNLWFVRFS